MSDELSTNQPLSDTDFQHVIRCAPLVSIDLIVRSRDDKVWLGLRKHEPARGKWFVPGGRIRKDESVAEAFKRIVRSELKLEKRIDEARFAGPFEHRYDTNRYQMPDVTTQYVVLAYELRVSESLDDSPDDYHSEKRWWAKDQILKSGDVHKNTSAYFKENPETAAHVGADSLRSEQQYKAIADRRNSFNTLLWQSPTLSLTAQAFLLNIVTDEGRYIAARLVCGGLAMAVALCTLQLFAKHRHQELVAARHLDEFERNHKHLGYVSINARQHSGTDETRLDSEQKESLQDFNEYVEKFRAFPSTVLWLMLQLIFVAVALALMFIAIKSANDFKGDRTVKTQAQ